jgi:hypothetical protein
VKTAPNLAHDIFQERVGSQVGRLHVVVALKVLDKVSARSAIAGLPIQPAIVKVDGRVASLKGVVLDVVSPPATDEHPHLIDQNQAAPFVTTRAGNTGGSKAGQQKGVGVGERVCGAACHTRALTHPTRTWQSMNVLLNTSKPAGMRLKLSALRFALKMTFSKM